MFLKLYYLITQFWTKIKKKLYYKKYKELESDYMRFLERGWSFLTVSINFSEVICV